jgi:hypothetical protein
MSKPIPDLDTAYEQAVVAVLNAIPCEQDDAEEMVEAIVNLVLSTLNSAFKDNIHATRNHLN